MNKYLMLSAAAVLASTAGAYANGTLHTFTFGTAGGGSYCDGGAVYVGADSGANSNSVRAWKHTNNNCSSGTSEGQGLVGKTAVLGKIANMSDTFYAKNYGIYSDQLNYTLPKKIANGHPWTLWVGINGTTSFEGNSGVLVNATGAKGTVSTTHLLQGLIQAHRSTH